MRSQSLTITRAGRDQGGVFVLTEMPAIPASEWFVRTLQLLVRSGADVPPDIFRHGAIGFVTIGVGALLTGLGKAPWGEVKPLLDELLSCVTAYTPPGATQPITNSTMIKAQIAEPATVFQLYEEVVSLHLGFSIRAKLSGYRSLVDAIMKTTSGPSTPTSTEPSASSSVDGLPLFESSRPSTG